MSTNSIAVVAPLLLPSSTSRGGTAASASVTAPASVSTTGSSSGTSSAPLSTCSTGGASRRVSQGAWHWGRDIRWRMGVGVVTVKKMCIISFCYVHPVHVFICISTCSRHITSPSAHLSVVKTLSVQALLYTCVSLRVTYYLQSTCGLFFIGAQTPSSHPHATTFSLAVPDFEPPLYCSVFHWNIIPIFASPTKCASSRPASRARTPISFLPRFLIF
ncbi:hypothetical protein C8R45DRAFT_426741 [Mycena sanguinolenta]|nr:hypothetical protein C8R45DRAFT_426741 [Mycena sanguinolenta]